MVNNLLKKSCIKSICALTFFVAMCLPAVAQKMSVASIKHLENDVTANREPNIRYDANGDKCALIKIQTTEHNFSFDVGSLGVVETIQQNAEHPSEIWLYVPEGVKSITIQHGVLGTINDYDFGFRVKKGKTYRLELTSDQVNTLVVDYNNSQYLYARIEPKDADFYINGLKQVLNNGVCEIPLAFGTYTYRITAPNYHTLEDQIMINDKSKMHELYVRLKQAFGYLSLTSTDKEFEGAEVFVDNKGIGKIPLDKIPVKSGAHKLTVSKKLYKAYTEDFEMTDSGFVSKPIVLQPNYATVELTVANDKEAQIYADGELLGTGKWNGRLEAGKHIIEAKGLSHTTTTTDITLANGEKRSIGLETPKPIYGSLEVTSNPSGAEVLLDGKSIGTTPLISGSILVGHHKLEIRKQGYKSETQDISLREGEPNRMPLFTLQSYCDATITCIPASAYLYIDGERVGQTPYKFNCLAGEYKIELRAHKYSSYSRKMRLDGSTQDMTITLHRNYTPDNQAYLQVGYNPVTVGGVNFGAGGYIKKFNIEGNFVLGLSESETIYWNDNSGESMPVATTYKPWAANLKVGYGLRMGSRVRLTPQVGCQYTRLNESIDSSGSYYSEVAKGGNAMSAVVGMNFSVAVAPFMGISVTPQYMMSVSKSDGFKALADISSKIKGYAEGFDCSINLYFPF